MNDFTNSRIKDKPLEQLVEDLGSLEAGEPGTVTFEMYKAAIQVRLAERLAAPRRWAAVAGVAAVVSALAAVASVIVAV